MATAMVTDATRASLPAFTTSVVCPACLRDVWVLYDAVSLERKDEVIECPHCGNRWPWQAVKVFRGMA